MDNKQSGGFDALAAKTLGGELRSMRKKQGIDIDTVAERLKLSIEQIEALEKGEYSLLPGIVFVTGFLRSYARLLKWDEQEFAGRLKMVVPDERGHVYAVERQAGKKGFDYRQNEKAAFPKWILGVAVGILFGGGIYAWQNKSNQETAYQNQQDSSAVQNSMQAPALKASNVTVSKMPDEKIADKVQAANASEASAVAASAEEVPVSVAPDELWLKVQYRSNLIVKDKNGKMVFSQIIPEGSERRFQGGAPYDVWIGISTGAQANFGGKEIPVKHYKAGARAASFSAGKK